MKLFELKNIVNAIYKSNWKRDFFYFNQLLVVWGKHNQRVPILNHP